MPENKSADILNLKVLKQYVQIINTMTVELLEMRQVTELEGSMSDPQAPGVHGHGTLKFLPTVFATMLM